MPEWKVTSWFSRSFWYCCMNATNSKRQNNARPRQKSQGGFSDVARVNVNPLYSLLALSCLPIDAQVRNDSDWHSQFHSHGKLLDRLNLYELPFKKEADSHFPASLPLHRVLVSLSVSWISRSGLNRVSIEVRQATGFRGYYSSIPFLV